ncbi:hypothetical protein NHJ6243_002717 [Beauveria neobassiana]
MSEDTQSEEEPGNCSRKVNMVQGLPASLLSKGNDDG